MLSFKPWSWLEAGAVSPKSNMAAATDKFVVRLKTEQGNRDGGRNGRRQRKDLELWLRPCEEKIKGGVKYDVQPYVLRRWADGVVRKRDRAVWPHPDGRAQRTWLKVKIDSKAYCLHRLIAFAYGNPKKISWRRFENAYEADHLDGNDVCKRGRVDVVTPAENQRRESARKELEKKKKARVKKRSATQAPRSQKKAKTR